MREFVCPKPFVNSQSTRLFPLFINLNESTDIVIPIARIETHPTTSPPGGRRAEGSFYRVRNGWRVCSADFGCRVNSTAAISRKEAVSSGERLDREWEDRAARSLHGQYRINGLNRI